MDCGAQSAGERADRPTVRNAAGPLGKGNAPGRDRQPRCRESFFGDALSSGVGTAFHGGTSQAAQCPSTVGSRTAVGGNSKRARGSPGSRRSQRQVGWHPLGREARRSVRGSSRSAGGSRTAWMARTGYASAAAISACAIAQHPCDRPQVLPAYGLQDLRNEEQNQKTKSNPNTMCLLSTLEETVEPDISI